MEAPTATELEANPVVQAAFAAAWADSFHDVPLLRHEEGGFIYFNPTTGEVTTRRTPPGRLGVLDVSSPPTITGAFLVAVYHTHPNPASAGWMPDPSSDDYELTDDTGVPWFIICVDEVYVIGPERRVGGLTGPPTYPK
jgi:hypothetical protein